MDCSTYFVRDAQFLVRVMSTNPSYLQTAVDGQVKNYRDWGIPLGRRMRALKLWFVIRDQGVSGPAGAHPPRSRAGAMAGRRNRRATAHWKILSPVRLQTLVVRHEPPGLDAAAVDAHTRAWAQAVNDSGEAYLTPTVIDGRWAVRVSLGGANTEQEHVVDLWRLMQRCAVGEYQRRNHREQGNSDDCCLQWWSVAWDTHRHRPRLPRRRHRPCRRLRT